MSIVPLKPGFEEVFTVSDYYDGPRRGTANFKGKPHFYDGIFDKVRDDYSDEYQLTAIPTHIFDVAMEDWAIGEGCERRSTLGKRPRSPIRRFLRTGHATTRFGVFWIRL